MICFLFSSESPLSLHERLGRLVKPNPSLLCFFLMNMKVLKRGIRYYLRFINNQISFAKMPKHLPGPSQRFSASYILLVFEILRFTHPAT